MDTFHIEMDAESLQRYTTSKHIGMPNERRDFMGLKVFMHQEKETEYGITTILGFDDGMGNVLIWFASDRKSYAVGDVVNLRATIKGYDVSDGVKKTVITRGKEIEPPKENPWRPCVVGTSRRR